MNTQPYAQEGSDFMGAAFEVHKEQVGGMLEEVYQESLEIELGLRGIPFKSKQELRIFYKGRELKKRHIPDLFVSGGIVVELNAVTALAPEHEAQVLNYLRVSKRPAGCLVNFTPIGKLEWKRLVLSDLQKN